MIRIVTIVGARPQIIKAAALSRSIRKSFSDRISEILIHTGQHYDDNMSGNFFGELGLQKPKYQLNIRGISHAEQTGRMIERIEQALVAEKPDFVLVFGDTNSTLAGAIAASKLAMPLVHVEAGLRSYNKLMPEEINRVLTDHVSTLLLCPGEIAVKNLAGEGIKSSGDAPHSIDSPGVFITGDIMIDNLVHFAKTAGRNSTILETLRIEPGNFILCTIHRDFNTDNPVRLSAILNGLLRMAYTGKMPVILPIHPRTRTRLYGDGTTFSFLEKDGDNLLKIISPLSYQDTINLQRNSRLVVTDSGGLQKEAYFFKKPSIVLRPETEWKEIVSNGCSALADASDELMLQAFQAFISSPPEIFPEVYGRGDAGDRICRLLIDEATRRP